MDHRLTVGDLAKGYRDALLAMHACRVEAGGDPRRWNQLVNDMQRLQLSLSATPDGRQAITALIEDECLTVRQWSATNALAWSPVQARAELEREASDEQGTAAFEARVTLREFDAGRLDTSWTPEA
jgi:hypothetical protein